MEVTMSTSSTRSTTLSGKVYDPVFLCMVGAVVLAVGTSIALRVMVAGHGPAAAHAADAPTFPSDVYQPNPKARPPAAPEPR
jgi:hypothetical protein